MSYIYLTNEKYEVLEDEKGACYVKDLSKQKYYYKRDLYASKTKGFEQKIVSWDFKDTIYLLLIVISFLSVVILVVNYKKYTFLHLNTSMKTEAILFLVVNLIVHEIGHAVTLKYFGKSRGKYRFKISFIFPTICVDTSELYLLPKFEKICVCYAGIMNNIILCGMIIIFSPNYSYLIVCVVPLILFNLLPFGGVQTDGYHIFINIMLGIRNYKIKENIVSKILRYIFYIVSLLILAITLKSFID